MERRRRRKRVVEREWLIFIKNNKTFKRFVGKIESQIKLTWILYSV